MRIAVTGSTGFVGRRIVETLIGDGHRVVAMVRSTSKARHIFPSDALKDRSITLKKCSLEDPHSLDALLGGCDACIHLVGIIRQIGQRQTFTKVHVEGTRAVVEACQRKDPSMRYVHMSALGAGAHRRSRYWDTKYRAEQIVRGSSLNWTIIEPGLIHGPGGELTQLAVEWARGKRAPYVFLPYFSRWKHNGLGFESPMVAPVYVEDVSRVFVGVLACAASSERVYPLTGSQTVRFRDMLRMYADSITPKPLRRPAIGIPWRLGAWQARAAAMIGLGGLLPFDEGMAIMGGQDSVADNTDVETDLGVEARGFQETLRAYADQL